MITAAKLYESICRTYFPRWKPWNFRYNSSWGRSGYCNKKEKIIFFGEISSELIIHEICHAVAPGPHSTSWQKRMRKTASKAETIDPELSKEIINDVEGYIALIEDLGIFDDKRIYLDQIYDAIINSNLQYGQTGVGDIINYVLSKNGIKKEWDKMDYNKKFRHGMVTAKNALNDMKRQNKLRQQLI